VINATLEEIIPTDNIIPIVREENKHCFCEHTEEQLVRIGNEQTSEIVKTNYLKPGRYDILGLGITKPLLECGLLDMTDGIDPNISLDTVVLTYLYNGVQVPIVHRLRRLNEQNELELAPLTTFNFSPQGNYREVRIDSYFTIPFVFNDKEVSVDLHVVGDVNLELGHATVVGRISQTEKTPDELRDFEFVGFSLDAKRTNLNRRPA